jgi:uncharacterized membrane protein YecN with MAPEG domain
MMGDLPVTTATAGLLGLLHVALGFRVTLTRFATKQSLGTGGADHARLGEEKRASPLLLASRSHANFTENVPIALILLGIAEHDLGQVWFVFTLALLLLVARVIHPIGMAMAAPNPFRAGGALLTWGMITAASAHALVRTVS